MTKHTPLVLVATLAACQPATDNAKDNTKVNGAQSDDCAAGVEKMLALEDEPTPPEAKAAMAASRIYVKPAVIASCRQMKWPAAATTCMKNVKTAADGRKCDAMLTAEQRDAATQAVNAAHEEAERKRAAPAGASTYVRERTDRLLYARPALHHVRSSIRSTCSS